MALLGMLARRHRKSAFSDLHGSNLTASELVYSAQMGYGFYGGLWERRKKAGNWGRNNTLPHLSPSK